MAWIKSYQEIERHPKTIILMGKMGWTLDITIAKLHRLWWWCADYADDGDLTRHAPETIAAAVGMGPEQGNALMGALAAAGFIDTDPCLRLHDWWRHFSDYLRGKYARNPEKWKAIEASYTNTCQTLAKRLPLDKEINREKEINRNNPSSDFAAFWQAYPRKTGKDAALKAWEKKAPSLSACLKALEWQVYQPQWAKDGGQFIPHASTWINGGRWLDEPLRDCSGAGAAVKPGKYAEAAKGGGDVRRKSE